MADTWSITVNGSTKTLTFDTHGHSIGDNRFIRFNQVQDVSIGGVRQVRNLGDNLNQWEYSIIVPVSSTTETSTTDVLEFFSSSYANGGVNSFTWTDDSGSTPVTRTVRLINSDITISRISNKYERITFTIEEVNE